MTTKKFQRLSNWQDFELLCLDILKNEWSDPEAKRNGRQGQQQFGVDVYGRPNNGDHWAASQCKNVDYEAGKVLSTAEIDEEVEKAKKFTPKLSSYIIISPANKDAALEEHCRKITDKHLTEGLFTVNIWSWEEIECHLRAHRNLREIYYSEYYPSTEGKKQSPDTPTFGLEKENTVQRNININVNVQNSHIKSLVIHSDSDTSQSLDTEYNAELDHAKELIENHKPSEALNYLENLKKRIWNKVNNQIKFRLLTNIGAAKYHLGDVEAPQKFIEAFQYDETSEKALCNMALAYQMLGNNEKAKEFANRVIAINPANDSAYATLIGLAEPSEPYEDVVSLVPKEFRKLPNVKFCFARSLRSRKRVDEAISILRDLVKSKYDHPEILGELGSAILESVTSNYEGLPIAFELSHDQKSKLNEALSFLDQAINTIKDDKVKPLRSDWFANRSSIFRLVGDYDKALEGLNEAIELSPQNADLLKQKAVFLIQKGELDEAKKLLLQSIEAGYSRGASLILAELQWQLNEVTEALRILNEFISTGEGNTQESIDAQWIQTAILIEADKLKEAQTIVENLRNIDPVNPLTLIYASKLAQKFGNNVESIQLAQEAIKNLNGESPVRQLVEVGKQLYDLEQYEDAITCFERIDIPRTDNSLLRMLISCYIKADNNEKLLEICNKIDSADGNSKLSHQVRLSIYEETNDLRSAKEYCQKYLEQNPENLDIQLRLALICERENKLEDIDAILNSVLKRKEFSLRESHIISHLCNARKRYKEMITVLYEMRRSYFNEADAHYFYIGNFFQIPEGERHLSSPSNVEIDTAFCLVGENGKENWYIIEKRKDINFQNGEINSDHEIAKMVIGKAVGHEIILNEGLLGEEKLTIKEIKSKYVHALHESVAKYKMLNPKDRRFISVSIREDDPNKFKDVQQSLVERNEYCKKVESLYKQGQITIGAFAGLVGSNVIEVFYGLSQMPSVGIKNAQGSHDEYAQARMLIENNEARVAIDITSIITLVNLDLNPSTFKDKNKLVVAQSTLDLIRELIAERSKFKDKHFMTVGFHEGQFYKQEVSKEDTERSIEFLNKILDWVSQYCTVEPIPTSLRIGKDLKEQMKETLGESFLDTILICKGLNCVLYSEDERLRVIAKNEHEINGIWTRIVLDHLFDNQLLPKQEYQGKVIELLSRNYRHSSINPQLLIEAARLAKWTAADPLQTALNYLSGDNSTEESALIVATNFFYELWKASPFPEQRDHIILLTLTRLMINRNRHSILQKLKSYIEQRFNLLPIELKRILALIEVWEKLNLI